MHATADARDNAATARDRYACGKMQAQIWQTKMNPEPLSLAELGWGPFFLSQLDADEFEATRPARVMAVHRDGLRLRGEDS